MSKHVNKHLLMIQNEIQIKREEMISLAKKLGHTHEDTIKCSQKLDELIFAYQKLVHQQQLEREVKKFFNHIVIFLPKVFSERIIML